MPQMIINPKKMNKQEIYKLLIGTVLPRPIAFVTSLSPHGVLNGAPFSFFNVVSTDPPMIGISCGRKSDGSMKDTAYNITKTKEFVVHTVDIKNVKVINDASIDYPSDISEVEQLGLTQAQSEKVQVPGIQEAYIRMECVLHQWIPLGGHDSKPSSDFLIGEIVSFFIDDGVYWDRKILVEKLHPVGRLAGTAYTTLGEMFSLPRKNYKDLNK